MNWKIGDKFVDLGYLKAGVGTVVDMTSRDLIVSFENHAHGYGAVFKNDKDLVPEQLYNSRLYKLMREE